MSKSFRIQENVYNTFLKLKNRKKQQQFLEKCFIYAWENREIETDYDVDLAFCGVKPSIKLSNNGGGLNNPTGINGTKPLKNKETDMSVGGQSDVSVMSDGCQSFISNKDISNKDKIEEIISSVDLRMKPVIEKWLQYKKERRESYKPTGLRECINKIIKLSDGNPETALLIVNESISNGWSGLFKLKEEKQQKKEEEPYRYWL